ncbi:MAG TPA: cytochrome-c peroxidase [Chitinophagaceae bacterium]|nr:cytochrome-c peroxidase [Chitinophagaceae bacterium]
MFNPIAYVRKLSWVVVTLVTITACSKKDAAADGGTLPDPVTAALNLPETPYNYAAIALPNHYNTPDVVNQINTPANNSITDWGATLGRVLFYEKKLSINQTVSCASCHNPALGFSDSAILSKGFAGGNTGRHSMSLINARYYTNGRFFWDERANSLEAQVLQPIQDAVEMGMRLDSVVARLQNNNYYPPLFTKAFGDATINSDRVSRALAQFVRSIVSYQSKYDVGRQLAGGGNPGQTNFPNFTAEENLGKALFFSANTGCAACHGTDAFTAPGPRNNGLDATITDAGVGGALGNPNLRGAFKAHSLRNIALTAPYMHDGRFRTLEQVIEHYNSGVQQSPTLSPPLVLPNNGGVRRLNLTAQEKAAMVAFLRTLTDNTLATDAKYSNPFK